MKIIRDEIHQPLQLSADFRQFIGRNAWATFDIETTGLSSNYNEIILVGFAESTSDDGLKITQFFAENPTEESEVLMATRELLDGVDCVITYNGASFDIPFYQKRCRKRGIEPGKPYNLDLFNLVKLDQPLRNSLPDLRQKTIEKYLGLSDRTDTISGGESVRMYQNYVSNGSKQLEEQILLHNHDDVQELAKIIPITERGYLPTYFCNNGMPVGNVRINSIDIDRKNRLNVKGHTLNQSLLIEAYEDDLGMHTSFSEKGFTLSIKLSEIGNFLAISEQKLRQINGINHNSPLFSTAEIEYLSQAELLTDNYLVFGPKNDLDHRASAWLGKHLVERTMNKWKV